MKSLIGLISCIAWMAGIVLANGFWSTLLAIVFPVWAWYLTAEHLLFNVVPAL